jgi:hypothetical protein
LTNGYGRLTNAEADDSPSARYQPDSRWTLNGRIGADGIDAWEPFSGVLELLKALEDISAAIG